MSSSATTTADVQRLLTACAELGAQLLALQHGLASRCGEDERVLAAVAATHAAVERLHVAAWEVELHTG